MKLGQRSRIFRVGLLCLFAIALTLLLTGCGSSTARARVMNASPGEPALTATIGNTSVANNIGYGAHSNYANVSSGSQTLNVEATGTSDVVLNQSVNLAANGNFTILVANYSTSVAAVTLTDDNSAPSSGQFKLRVIQASPALGTADVYVLAPGDSVSSASASVTSLEFDAASNYLSLPVGT